MKFAVFLCVLALLVLVEGRHKKHHPKKFPWFAGRRPGFYRFGFHRGFPGHGFPGGFPGHGFPGGFPGGGGGMYPYNPYLSGMSGGGVAGAAAFAAGGGVAGAAAFAAGGGVAGAAAFAGGRSYTGGDMFYSGGDGLGGGGDDGYYSGFGDGDGGFGDGGFDDGGYSGGLIGGAGGMTGGAGGMIGGAGGMIGGAGGMIGGAGGLGGRSYMGGRSGFTHWQFNRCKCQRRCPKNKRYIGKCKLCKGCKLVICCKYTRPKWGGRWTG